MYNIIFTRAAAKEYAKLETHIQDQIDMRLTMLSKGEFHLLNIDKMEGKVNIFRMRSGDYRILYEKQDTILTISIVRVKHRKEVYRGY